jgi:hypothetical protein
MPKLALTRKGQVFVPATRAAQIEADKIKPGVPLMGDVAARRNPQFHRLYWAFCTYVAEALNSGPGDIEWTQEMVSNRLKLATGRAEIVAIPAALQRHYGVPHAVMPASISFAKMDETEFGQFVDRSITYILTEFGAWVQDHPDWVHVRDIVHHARKGMEAT